MARAPLILTYHAIEEGASPLCVSPQLFGEHLDAIAAAGGRCSTVADLARGLRAGDVDARTVAITFDDGFESTFEVAVPMLLERGLTATVFCVSGHLGGVSDWATQRPGTIHRPLAGPPALAQASAAGIEIASHGVRHEPLGAVPERIVERELRESREQLEQVISRKVESFAYPYGSLPDRTGLRRVAELYLAACTTRLGRAGSADPYRLPRVDSHYLRRPALLQRAAEASLGPYLGLRSAGARLRRRVASDYSLPPRRQEERSRHGR